MARKKTKNRVPKEVAEEVRARSEGQCEAMNFPTCTGHAEQLHHRRLRSQGGGHTVENLIAVCSSCHTWFHREVAAATSQGWIVRSVHEPGEVPMKYRGRPALLGADGHIHYQEIDG